MKIRWVGLAPIVALPLVVYGWVGGPPSRRDFSLETVRVVLELTPEQMKQATDIIKIGQAAKFELLDRLKEKFERVNELVRTEVPKESEIRPVAHEIAALQEQLIVRDAQMQIAFRKVLNPHQIEKLNRLEQINPSGPGPHRQKKSDGGPPFQRNDP